MILANFRMHRTGPDRAGQVVGHRCRRRRRREISVRGGDKLAATVRCKNSRSPHHGSRERRCAPDRPSCRIRGQLPASRPLGPFGVMVMFGRMLCVLHEYPPGMPDDVGFDAVLRSRVFDCLLLYYVLVAARCGHVLIRVHESDRHAHGRSAMRLRYCLVVPCALRRYNDGDRTRALHSGKVPLASRTACAFRPLPALSPVA
jgi:hypothetical protein